MKLKLIKRTIYSFSDNEKEFDEIIIKLLKEYDKKLNDKIIL